VQVEGAGVAREEYGTIRIHDAYIRYRLPLMVEVQSDVRGIRYVNSRQSVGKHRTAMPVE